MIIRTIAAAAIAIATLAAVANASPHSQPVNLSKCFGGLDPATTLCPGSQKPVGAPCVVFQADIGVANIISPRQTAE